MIGIDFHEWNIDLGKVFQASADFDVVLAGSVYIALKTPKTKEIHISSLYYVMGGTMTVSIYRDPVLSANGTALLSTCLKDGYEVPTFESWHTPTITSSGTLFRTFRVMGGSTGATSLPSTVGSQSHRVLKQDTYYLIKLTTSANNSIVQADYQWSEL